MPQGGHWFWWEDFKKNCRMGGHPPCTPTMENSAPLNICPRVWINISQFAIRNTFKRTWNSGKLKNEQNYGTKNLYEKNLIKIIANIKQRARSLNRLLLQKHLFDILICALSTVTVCISANSLNLSLSPHPYLLQFRD